MKIENICNFYASKYHLSVVLYEYLRKNSRKEVVTFFEDGIEEEIKVLEEKTNKTIKNKVNFCSNKNIEDTEIKEGKSTIFILKGSDFYLKEANAYIKDELKFTKKTKVKIINCYDFDQQREFFNDIIRGSDKILYTTGESYVNTNFSILS